MVRVLLCREELNTSTNEVDEICEVVLLPASILEGVAFPDRLASGLPNGLAAAIVAGCRWVWNEVGEYWECLLPTATPEPTATNTRGPDINATARAKARATADARATARAEARAATAHPCQSAPSCGT